MSEDLPKVWSGQAGIWKYHVPVILGLAVWVLWPSLWNVFNVVWFIVVIIPLVYFIIFFILVPVQLRVNHDILAYRYWFHWKKIPFDKVLKIHKKLFFLGVVLFSDNSRFFFFIEPENRHLINNDNLHLRYQFEPKQPIRDEAKKLPIWFSSLVFLSAGLVCYLLTNLITRPFEHKQEKLGFINSIIHFENTYGYMFSLLGIIILFQWLVFKKPNDRDRFVLCFLLGVFIAQLCLKFL